MSATNGPTTAAGSSTTRVGQMGTSTASDWGDIWSRTIKQFQVTFIAFGAIALMAAYKATRPFAWTILIIAGLSRAGALGTLANNYAKKVFGE